MTLLFTENYNKLAPFTFKFYDFDKDNFITKEDVRTVLSYVPLNIKNKAHNALKFERYIKKILF